ncbi:MAG TPA: RNA-binding protein [Spirochaetota bacterium]|jgi:RNA recognition motif-containing protein|nr:MAG: RNA recognition motif [Spirochaetes bacterium ADurb.Bin133]HNZ27757.1 RNA-binding protein [Spirochaetota bacterium]HOF01028.1 RNA-binding protein [Spirochaetota bacterium]HOS32409.1 RNA-binding protein [Spirochaetota bacterium]HOS55819.1 RNA-binding protein [Spirochaetota bacterium]
MPISLYVGNLPYSVNEDSLKEIFAEFGNVVSLRVITDKLSGKSKGFAFVEMSTQEEADAAIKALDNGEIDGRNIRVNIAKPKEDNFKDGERRNFKGKFNSKRRF